MARYSLINVSKRENGLVSGNWMQDVNGTKEEAFKRARETEKVNSNRISVAVVEGLNYIPDYSHKNNLEEIIL